MVPGQFSLMHTEVMKDCCEVMVDAPARQRRVLQIVLCINAAMFLMEFGAGLLAGSTALLADSVDMLGDALVYGFSLYVVSRATVWQARASLLKGAVMAIFGLGVLLEVILKIARGIVPAAGLMGALASSPSPPTWSVCSCYGGVEPTTSTCAPRGRARGMT